MSDYINEALSLYGLENAKVTLLRHNENRTYRVDCDGQSYCLRIKSPVSGFDLSVFDGDKEKLLRSELEFITALGEQTDILIQQPVKTLSGDFVAKLPDKTLASLLCWMDGIPFDNVNRTQQMLICAGETLAKLRNVQEANHQLNNYHRYSYDQKLIQKLVLKAEQGQEYLPIETIRSIIKALDTVTKIMDELDESGKLFISQADPSLSNMIWSEGKVGLIDWSLSGYAHSYMDLGGLMGATSDREEQRLLLKGWENIRGKTDRRYIDAYFSLTVLLFVCCQYTRAKEWVEWFPSALERWQTTIFEPLVSGEPLTCIL